MISSGASRPVQSVKASAPWCSSMPRPSLHFAPAASTSARNFSHAAAVDRVEDHHVRGDDPRGQHRRRLGIEAGGRGVEDEIDFLQRGGKFLLEPAHRAEILGRARERAGGELAR